MKRVLVLMSTYNGEKYIKKQILSILNQNGVYCDLLIRDDGSQDTTIPLIKYFEKNYSQRIKLIKGDNEGYKRSFVDLIYNADNDYDYYAFSDQDDVWLPDKVKAGIEGIKDKNTPSLYYAMMTEVNENLDKLSKQQSFKSVPGYKEILFQNFVQGSTIIFNNHFLRLVKTYRVKDEVPHDVFLPILAKYCGNIVGDHDSYILYRKHEDAVTVKMKSNYFKNFVSEIFSDYKLTNYADILLAGYKKYIKKQYIPYLEKVKNYRNIKNKVTLLCDKDIRKFTIKGTILLKMTIAFNKLK
ncbi:glycosyltransferase [Limosilactobacillus fermentum]